MSNKNSTFFEALPPVLSREEENELGRKLKSKNKKVVKDARLKLVEHNIRLVIKIAGDYTKASGTLDMDDLISEGSIGLTAAVKKFDVDRGVKFSTYSAFWIKQKIRRAIGNNSRTVRLPIHMIDKGKKIRLYVDEFTFRFGYAPSAKTIQKRFGVSEAVAIHGLVYKDNTTSLQMPVGKGDSETLTELQDIFIDEDSVTSSELAESNDDLCDLKKHMRKVLNKREREFLKARFGIRTGEPMTLEEVGDIFGVTRERVRQIQNIALKKIRRSIERSKTQENETQESNHVKSN